MKKHIPNTLTLCNLICGCIAAYMALQPEPQYATAFYFIIGGAVFDFFDGFAARLLHVSSPLGKELDSLADDITFGMAPAAIVFAMLRQTVPAIVPEGHWAAIALPFAAFLIAAFSALRLAKFNLDERQTTSFIGLPTPANALFWGALATAAHTHIATTPWAAWALLAGVVASSLILVAEVPMFALKFKHFGWKGNALRYTFLIVSAALIISFGLVAVALAVVLYVLLSLLTQHR